MIETGHSKYTQLNSFRGFTGRIVLTQGDVMRKGHKCSDEEKSSITAWYLQQRATCHKERNVRLIDPSARKSGLLTFYKA